MKQRSLFLVISGIILYLFGLLLGSALSAGLAWGEIETRLHTSFPPTAGLKTLKCPLLLAPAESGIITATFDNPTNELVTPEISLEINTTVGAKQTGQSLSLAPGAAQTLSWTVGAGDRIFGRLILVGVYQSQYRQLGSRVAQCSILVLGLFGLSGIQTLTVIFAASILCLVLGSALWLLGMRQPGRPVSAASNPGGVLAATVLAAMLTSLPRWWGLTLFCLSLTVLMIGVILTEYILFPSRHK
jgi:hypothetical protein